jgi:signal transduction histidine kinase
MKLSGRRTVISGFAVGLALVLLFSLAAFRTSDQYTQTVNQLVHSNTTQENLLTLLSELDEAESGQRGYVITGNATFLQPYQAGIDSINGTLFELSGLVVGDANLTAGYLELQPLVHEKLAELKEAITDRQTQGFGAAEADINTGVGNEYMVQLRTIIADMNAHVIASEDQELALASRQGSERSYFSFFVTLFAVGLIALGVYAADLNLSREQAARLAAERNRSRAELLQDILTHDIRNYNQIVRSNAELLRETLRDEKSKQFVGAIERAVDGETELVQKARLIARITSEENLALAGTSLRDSLERSLALIRSAFPNKTILASVEVPDGAQVLADPLLDEVFVNIISNAVKNTEGSEPHVEIQVKATQEGGQTNTQERKYWEVSIADHGRGIPDDSKPGVFTRYLGTAKGRGLGLSIARALVVDRYSGKIELRNRVEGDYRKGTRVEIWLPMK